MHLSAYAELQDWSGSSTFVPGGMSAHFDLQQRLSHRVQPLV